MLSKVQDFRLHTDSMGFYHVQAAAQVKRRLAALELDMDRQQGWVRGGSKTEVICTALRPSMKNVPFWLHILQLISRSSERAEAQIQASC